MSSDAEEKPVSKAALNRAHHADRPYGNYHNYYYHRTPVIPDARLSLLPQSLFESLHILDLGCNAGKISLETVTHLGAASTLGIDIDPYLVDQALASRGETANVEFMLGDFMQDPEAYFSGLQKRCETVLLLSITKWLHLQHGDAGLKRLFNALYRYLPSSGTLIIEPQEWDNYKTACKKNKTLKPMFKTLEMRPPFQSELETLGFKLGQKIEREEGGFSRPLMVWVKGEAVWDVSEHVLT